MDLSFFEPLQAWLHDHDQWLGPVIALVAFLESLAGLGLFLPGVAMLFALGVLAGSGMLEPLPMLLWAYSGAALGDGVSFLIGFKFHRNIKNWWPFVRHPDWLEKGETFFHQYGVQSIILGRFVGPIRPVMPLVAGMLDMSPRQFYSVNLLSAIPWAILYMMPGYLTGTALALTEQLPPEVMLVAGVIVLASFLWALFIYHLDRHLSQVYSSLLVPTLLLMLSNFGLAMLTTLDISGQLRDLDSYFQAQVGILNSQLIYGIFSILTWLGSLVTLWLPFSSVLLWYWFKQRIQKLYIALLGFAGLEVTLWLMKWGIDKPRPAAVENLDPFSFPSGHTAQAAYILLLFSLCFSRKLSLFLQVVFYGTINSLILLVGTSRMVLNVHWFSDVAAGLLLGVFWVSVVMLLERFQAGESGYGTPRGSI
ncbi:MAG: VTT domain-containing protein [Endozoicomonas sp.]